MSNGIRERKTPGEERKLYNSKGSEFCSDEIYGVRVTVERIRGRKKGKF